MDSDTTEALRRLVGVADCSLVLGKLELLGEGGRKFSQVDARKEISILQGTYNDLPIIRGCHETN